jgi:hypothetical protein
VEQARTLRSLLESSATQASCTTSTPNPSRSVPSDFGCRKAVLRYVQVSHKSGKFNSDDSTATPERQNQNVILSINKRTEASTVQYSTDSKTPTTLNHPRSVPSVPSVLPVLTAPVPLPPASPPVPNHIDQPRSGASLPHFPSPHSFPSSRAA